MRLLDSFFILSLCPVLREFMISQTGKKLYSPFQEISSYLKIFNSKITFLNQIVDAFTHLRQRLEYLELERHIHNIRNEEVKKEYFRILSKVLEAEKGLSHFAEVFNNSK
jgi:hypothetical protein